MTNRDSNGRLLIDAKLVAVLTAVLTLLVGILGAAVGFGYGKGLIDQHLTGIDSQLVAVQGQMLKMHEQLDTIDKELVALRAQVEKHRETSETGPDIIRYYVKPPPAKGRKP